jgi:hypothetical protein
LAAARIVKVVARECGIPVVEHTLQRSGCHMWRNGALLHKLAGLVLPQTPEGIYVIATVVGVPNRV